MIQNINIVQIGNNDYNSVNIFLFEILKNKEQFIFNKFINLPPKFQKLKYLKINLNTFIFIIQYRKFFGFYFNNKEDFKNYYLNYDLSIDEKEILKYKKIKIEGLNINENKIEEIIEDKNINICDINLNINLKKYYIKGYKEVKSIYCENEIEKTNLIELVKEIINKNGFKKLKYINITIGYINESPYNLSTNHFYYYLSKLIKNSENLKSLILRIHPNNFNNNISYFLSLIEDLNKLKIFNIIENCEEPKYY